MAEGRLFLRMTSPLLCLQRKLGLGLRSASKQCRYTDERSLKNSSSLAVWSSLYLIWLSPICVSMCLSGCVCPCTCVRVCWCACVCAWPPAPAPMCWLRGPGREPGPCCQYLSSLFRLHCSVPEVTTCLQAAAPGTRQSGRGQLSVTLFSPGLEGVGAGGSK